MEVRVATGEEALQLLRVLASALEGDLASLSAHVAIYTYNVLLRTLLHRLNTTRIGNNLDALVEL